MSFWISLAPKIMDKMGQMKILASLAESWA
jgi:hypothetical protein